MGPGARPGLGEALGNCRGGLGEARASGAARAAARLAGGTRTARARGRPSRKTSPPGGAGGGATGVATEPALRFIRFRDLVLPEIGGGAALDSALLLSTLKSLLDDKPAADPVAATLRDVAAKGRSGALVTRLELAPDFATVSVATTLWVRQGRDQWMPGVSRSAQVRPDHLGPNAGQP